MDQNNLGRNSWQETLPRRKCSLRDWLGFLILVLCVSDTLLAKGLVSGPTSDEHLKRALAPGDLKLRRSLNQTSSSHETDLRYQGPSQVPAIKGVATHQFFEYASQVAVELMKSNFQKVCHSQLTFTYCSPLYGGTNVGFQLRL